MKPRRIAVPGIVAAGGALVVVTCIAAFQGKEKQVPRRRGAPLGRTETAPPPAAPDAWEAPEEKPRSSVDPRGSSPGSSPEVRPAGPVEFHGQRLADIRGALVESFRDLLEAALSDPAAEVRTAAIPALESAPPQEDLEREWATAVLFRRYSREGEATIRKSLLEALALRQPGDLLVPVLLDLWDVERDAGIRADLVRRLGVHAAANPEEIRSILSVWQDQDEASEVREAIDTVCRSLNTQE